jgi:hypothetical protein
MTGGSDDKQRVAPTIFQEDDYLVPSPILEDGGHQTGRLPQEIPIDVLRELHVPENPVKAIRAKCIDCSGGNATEARKCVAYKCPLWPFRMGKNPFWGKSDDADLTSAPELEGATP